MYKKITMFLLLLMLVLSGCSAKLSDKNERFEAKGVNYTIQLPSTWEKTTDFKVRYSNEAVFGAQDKKSNSTLIIMGQRKESLNLDGDFSKRMRKELKTQYNYDKESEIFMKEFKIGKYKGVKYTLDTMFDKRSTWLHLYYIETEHGVLQLNYYSANDGGHEKRAEIIDESAHSIKETSDSGDEDLESEDQVMFKNEKISVELIGVMTIKGDRNKELLALRYSVTNISAEEDVTAELWDKTIQVTQNEKKLTIGSVPKDNTMLDIPKLIEQKGKNIPVGSSSEGVSIYELEDNSNVTLVPEKERFKDAKEQPIVISERTEGEANE